MPTQNGRMELNMKKIIGFGCDHGGFELKNEMIKHLEDRGFKVKDYGTYENKSCDYPDIAIRVCKGIISGECELGILICGTGIGMSLAANKVKSIRAACCSDIFSAKYTRLHNDSQILCLGGRVVGAGLAAELVDVFVDTDFSGDERHQKRIDKVTAVENLEI
jgi:ribose 5-phosphate isomerase B